MSPVRIAFLGIGLLALFPAGCAVNRMQLERDVRELLAGCGVEPASLRASMGSRTRTGITVFPVTAAEVAAVASGLGLEEIPADAGDGDVTDWLADGTSQYDHPLLDRPAGVRIYRSDRRPDSLRLAGGSSFEYALLFWDEANGEALLQLSYAYG